MRTKVNVVAPFPKTGLSVMQIAKATGLGYATVWRHVHGLRAIQAEHALVYERALDIHRSKFRPDLWPPQPRASKKAVSEDENPVKDSVLETA